MASTTTATRSVEELQKENEALKKELEALRPRLKGFKSEEDEKAKVLAVFNKYDSDKSGTIDRKEFDVLAYEAGYDPAHLDDDGIAKIWAEIRPANPTGITFDEFYRWFKASSGSKKASGFKLGNAVRLQAKAWRKSGSKAVAKAAKKAATTAPAKAAASTGETKVAATSTTTTTSSAAPTGTFTVRVQTGDLKDSKLGVSLSIKSDQESANKARADLGIPAAEAKNFFAVLDVAVVAGKDEGAGEIAGLINTLPVEMAPVPVKSINCELATDTTGQRVLRTTLLGGIGLAAIAANFTGDAEKIIPAGEFDFRVAVETGLILGSRPTAADLSARLSVLARAGALFRAREAEIFNLVFDEERSKQLIAALTFISGTNFELSTPSLAALLLNFIPGIAESDIQDQFDAIWQQVAGLSTMSPVPSVATTVIGPRRLVIGSENVTVSLDFIGFDFTPIFALASTLTKD